MSRIKKCSGALNIKKKKYLGTYVNVWSNEYELAHGEFGDQLKLCFALFIIAVHCTQRILWYVDAATGYIMCFLKCNLKFSLESFGVDLSQSFISQVHNFQKLKIISLKAVNIFSTKNKSNLFEWNCLFSSSYSGVTAIFTAMWVILSEGPIT